MPARAYTFDRPVLKQAHGPEALTVERPVEARQEEIRALLGPLWPKLKWTTRRVVIPEEAGSSPAGHPIAAGDLGSARSHTPCDAGSIPAPATKPNGPVAQQVAQLPCKEKVAGSTPARSTLLT